MAFTNPRLPESLQHYQTAVAQLQAGKPDLAQLQIQIVLDQEPQWLPALNLKAALLARTGQHHAALALYHHILQDSPDEPDVLANLGNLYLQMNELLQAEAVLLKSLHSNPGHLDATVNLGLVLSRLHRFTEADTLLTSALATHSASPLLHFSRGYLMSQAGQHRTAIAHYRHALQLNPHYLAATHSIITSSAYVADIAPATTLELTRQYADQLAQGITACQQWSNAKTPDKLLRVGLVSADFQNHPVGYFLAAVLEALGSGQHRKQLRKDIHLTAYQCMPFTTDATQQRLRAQMDQWRQVHTLSDQAFAELVQQDHIDILIDLGGLTANHRLGMFAHKPAPVQTSWLGYYASPGLPTIDYLLADAISVPDPERSGYPETLWYLPHSRLPLFKPEQVFTSPLPALNPDNPFTFGCFQDTDKINATTLKIWSQILAACPESCLRIQSRSFNSTEKKAGFIQALAAAGIPASQYILLPEAPLPDYLQAHSEVDLILDTFPYPGGTTSNFALWQGVPTLTLTGTGMLQRQGEMFMKAAGLEDWVCDSLAQYRAMAIHYGSRNPQAIQKLAALRTELPSLLDKQPAADLALFASELNKALRGMWRCYCESGSSLPGQL